MRMTTAKNLPKVCFLCGRNGATDPLDAHHIFGGANRKLSERYALVVPLCHDRCHENGKDAVHRSAATAQALHEFGQRLAMERFGWSIEEFRAVFGRNYLPDPSGDSLRGPGFFPAGKETGERKPPKETYSEAVSFGILPRRQRGSAPFDPLTGDEGRGMKDGGFRILDEEVRPVWL